MLPCLGLAGPQVPVYLACLQCRQVGVPPVSPAIDLAGLSGAFRKSRSILPQLSRAWRCLLRGDSLPLILHQKLAAQVLLDLDLHPCVGRMSSAGQQPQGAPLALDSVVPGHLAPMFEARESLRPDQPGIW